jgi:ribosomal protein L27
MKRGETTNRRRRKSGARVLVLERLGGPAAVVLGNTIFVEKRGSKTETEVVIAAAERLYAARDGGAV